MTAIDTRLGLNVHSLKNVFGRFRMTLIILGYMGLPKNISIRVNYFLFVKVRIIQFKII